MFSLQGKRALVTGASGLLGAHFARVLRGAGAEVVLAARRPDSCAALAAELGATVVALDVQATDSVAPAFDAAGRVDILVNNAGIAATRGFLEHSLDDFDRVLEVNLRGAFLVGQEAARRMAAAKTGGSIINIASVLGARIIPGVAGYTAAKAGLIHLTRQMAVELARHNIRVNAIAPGYIASDINAEFFATEAGQAMVKRIPQRRLGNPDDLSGPLLLLASDAGRHMTGSVVTVDGGHSVNPL
ncbi:SDR family NAD(P)-dependent oxidoreductase [Roseococcus suduntuyensis]|uniref:NAD(P)-dependent dehydrogenase (Short-subunit alcohol dehydrogenase family) n=1 Tax=Roseococcus suduntuyensis TaxID=455361 RepID=A0A840AE37_9PROT|nr:SDR family oxidoreductase [Roseococcus suduntuyensis]MBB3898753.1 NAD(P)-dependent dehydrogenase (short-subunit alcohol dehydrogenase family) [Roseococcus suduntuyensis]